MNHYTATLAETEAELAAFAAEIKSGQTAMLNEYVISDFFMRWARGRNFSTQVAAVTAYLQNDVDQARRELARHEAEVAEASRIDGMAITPETAKKVAAKLGRQLNKDKRARIANIVGPAWQQIANPQSREAAIAALTEATGRQIAAV